jgi:hypothetical protein
MICTSFNGEEVRFLLEAQKILHSAGGSSLVSWNQAPFLKTRDIGNEAVGDSKNRSQLGTQAHTSRPVAGCSPRKLERTFSATDFSECWWMMLQQQTLTRLG